MIFGLERPFKPISLFVAARAMAGAQAKFGPRVCSWQWAKPFIAKALSRVYGLVA